jgi:phosphoribosylglycinamide formyltransferase-1
MKIGVFAYNFMHQKTQNGLQNLMLAGYKPEIIFAADPIKLNFYQSKIRTSPKDLFLWHPRDIAKFHNIDYVVCQHNSEEISKIVKEKKLDLGIILGARILKPIAFNDFSVGVLNMHPGILPDNRGLDNLKWAISKKIPQGVTAHLIDEKIDKGLKIVQEKIKIYQDDTLLDLQIRLQNLEQKLMLKSIKYIEKNGKNGLQCFNDDGQYFKSMPEVEEKKLFLDFEEYKKIYSEG